MSKGFKITLLVFIFLLGGYFLLSKAFYALQFSDPAIVTLSSDERAEGLYKAMESNTVDFKCNRLLNVRSVDLKLKIEFDYPLVDFSGLVQISEQSLKDDRLVYERIIYNETGSFPNEIVLSGFCVNQMDNAEHLFRLTFVERSGAMYSWQYGFSAAELESSEAFQLVLAIDELTTKNVVRKK